MRPPLRPPCLRKTWLLLSTPVPAPRIYVPRRIATTSSSNPAAVDLPKLLVAHGSSQHNSLPTFLAYAKRTNLAPEKTVYVGTHYEYTTALALMRLGFSLIRIGKSSDAGIDLIGHWVLGPLREPLPVIVQCKARKISLNPQHIRELEGSFQGTPAGWKRKEVLGLLVTTRKATKGMLEALAQSRWAMGFVLVSRTGLVEQFVWNRAATDKGLEGVGVTVRHTPRALLDPVDVVDNTESDETPKRTKKRQDKFKTAGTQKDIQLTWMGSPIFPDRHSLDPETVDLMRYVVPGDDEYQASITGKERRYIDKNGIARVKSAALAPSPRGGQIGGPRGRPRTTPRPQGRPRKVKKSKTEDEPTITTDGKKRIGRPKGSKNKPKPVTDAG
ncbi:hypothetical protein NX059_002824 [Plenodomus lindquistii]|nr:hypothetical protein NX059_002824 [Plenodomus lindquistii]